MKKIKVSALNLKNTLENTDAPLVYGLSGLSRVGKSAFDNIAFQNKISVYNISDTVESKFITPLTNINTSIFITIKSIVLSNIVNEELVIGLTANSIADRHVLIRRSGSYRVIDFKYGRVNGLLAFSVTNKYSHVQFVIEAEACNNGSIAANLLKINNTIDTSAFTTVPIT